MEKLGINGASATTTSAGRLYASSEDEGCYHKHDSAEDG